MSGRKKKIIMLAGAVLAILLAFNQTFPVSAPQAPPVPKQQAKPSTNVYDQPSSILFVVNKKRPLPDGYSPSDLNGPLRKDAKSALDALTNDASKQGVSFKIISGYRSQSSQANLYNSYVNKDGQAQADTYSARPRHSEHQTGLAVDLGSSDGKCDLEICFGQTSSGIWLKSNAHKYGFIIRYPEGKTPITGYQYEPWHLRYVGNDAAGQVNSSNKTLEEHFNLSPAPSY